MQYRERPLRACPVPSEVLPAAGGASIAPGILQIAAITVYWEWTRSTEASERKKQAEKQLATQLRAEAASQRQVRFHLGAKAPAVGVCLAPCTIFVSMATCTTGASFICHCCMLHGALLSCNAETALQLLLTQNEAQERSIRALSDRIKALEAQRRSWWRGATKGSAAQHLLPPEDPVTATLAPAVQH